MYLIKELPEIKGNSGFAETCRLCIENIKPQSIELTPDEIEWIISHVLPLPFEGMDDRYIYKKRLIASKLKALTEGGE